MVKRSDGQATRQRIFDAAQQVWAEHGFRDATVAMIAKAAGCNQAAINYYYSSKDDLYAEVWRQSFATAIAHYPIDGGVAEDAAVEERFRGFIHTRLRFLLEGGRESVAGRLLLRELSQPNAVIDQVRGEVIGRFRFHIKGLIRAIVGTELDRQQEQFCLLSVVHQILMFGLQHHRLPGMQAPKWTPDRIAALADHITTFSLAGLRAVTTTGVTR